MADQTVFRVEPGQGDAGHRRRQGKGEIDQGIDHPLARNSVAHQHPGNQQAEDAVD